MAIKVNRHEVICVLLIAALAVNSVVHWIHPAYRYYERNISRLDERYQRLYDDFTSDVSTNIAPSIIFATTNSIAASVAIVRSMSGGDSDSGSPSSFDGSPGKFGKFSRTTLTNSFDIVGHYFKVGDLRGAWIDGYAYYLGDDYRGHQITYLSPSVMRTGDIWYYFSRAHRSIDVSSNKSVTPNKDISL